jgi:hypothetical protein
MQLGTHEQILQTGSSFVDDYTLGLQFPACDFAGYFLFATLDGDGPCQALNLGLLVGSHDGRDLGFPALVGDAREVVVIRSLIHDGVSYRSPDDSSYTRGDVVYSRAGLDVQVADVARIRGRWPRFELFFVDPGFDIVYELTGTARYAHWVPDHVYSTMYSYVVFPEFAFQGTITLQGVAHDVSGVGAFDHVNGRNVASATSPGVGFWHYDPVMWEGGGASNILYFVGSAGEVVVGTGVTTVPDGVYHPAPRCSVEHLEIALGGPNSGVGEGTQAVPRKWRARLEASHGTLEYVAQAVPVRAPSGRAVTEANSLFDAAGVFTGSDGAATQLRGRGYGEFMGGSVDISNPTCVPERR